MNVCAPRVGSADCCASSTTRAMLRDSVVAGRADENVRPSCGPHVGWHTRCAIVTWRGCARVRTGPPDGHLFGERVRLPVERVPAYLTRDHARKRLLVVDRRLVRLPAARRLE